MPLRKRMPLEVRYIKKFPHSNLSMVHNVFQLQRSCAVIVGVVHHIAAYYGALRVKLFDTSVYFASNVAKQWYVYLNSRNTTREKCCLVELCLLTLTSVAS